MTIAPFATATLFLDGLLAGVFLCSAMVEHAVARLDAPAWIAFVQAKEKVFGPVMPAFFGLGLLATIGMGVATLPDARWLAAAVLLLGAGVVTARENLPLNARFSSWSAAAYPADWAALRARWRRWNVARVAMAVAAFGAVLV